MSLPEEFFARPIAHRALHDLKRGRPENSRAAVRAAVSHGYGIEIDLQLSADEAAMVFHDYGLQRLTGQSGPLRGRRAAELAEIALIGGDDGIPTFPEILALVDGKVPLLVELKDQDGALGPNVGPLEAAVARAAEGYRGPLAFMSFNPHSMIELGRIAPHSIRGLTTCGLESKDWPPSPRETRQRLSTIPDLDAAGACFISHEACDLDSPSVSAIKARGLPVFCWTIRTPKAEAEARRIADNVTFEGYLAA